jgi:23S rRNA (adenine2503-C2)-methyltransferase
MSTTMDKADSPPLDILSLTRAGLEAAAARLAPAAAGSAARIYAQALKTGCFDPEALGLGASKARAWRESFYMTKLAPLSLVQEPGDFGPTAKALLGTQDGLRIECVLIPMSTRRPEEGRATLCVSSQVGCRMGCTFCETGSRGLARSLSAGEIVGQVIAARHLLGWSFRNIVFMGMGEPFDNAEAVFASLDVLFDQSGLGYAQDRITICSSGHVEGIGLLAKKPWRRLNLSISLNATEDELRGKLMPIGRRWPLEQLGAALRAYPKRANFVLGLNYCLIPGLNDGPRDAERLKAICEAFGSRGPGSERSRVLLNLIPYNPGTAPIGRAPSEDEIDRFLGLARAAGIEARRRATRGRSIMAACGQLGGPREEGRLIAPS